MRITKKFKNSERIYKGKFYKLTCSAGFVLQNMKIWEINTRSMTTLLEIEGTNLVRWDDSLEDDGIQNFEAKKEQFERKQRNNGRKKGF